MLQRMLLSIAISLHFIQVFDALASQRSMKLHHGNMGAHRVGNDFSPKGGLCHGCATIPGQDHDSHWYLSSAAMIVMLVESDRMRL